MAEAVDIKKQIIDDMLETLKEQVSRYKSLINSNDVTLDQLKDFDNQISEIYDTLQKVSNTELTLLVSEIEDYKTQFQAKLSEFENILNNIDVSNITLNLTPEQLESLKGEKGDKGEDGLNGTFETLTDEQKALLKGEKGLDGEDGLSAYEVAVNQGFVGTELEWLESLKGSGGGSVVYPIPFENVGTETLKLNDELARLSQTLGQLQGGTISGVNINQLNGELQGVKGSISSLSNQLNFVMNKLNDVYQYNEETYEDELVEYGLISKVNQLYAEYTPASGI